MKRAFLASVVTVAAISAAVLGYQHANGGGKASESADSIAAMRAEGPPALARLLAEREGLIRSSNASSVEREQQLNDLVADIRAVSGQHYGEHSELYWYTDLDQAKQVSVESGKPILSLRLLGDLREELTCANSRFFRVLLYANPEIAAEMKSKFVLHWSSERDVPIVTTDFGNGRQLKRTVTGNSLHYVLDSEGHPLDALPGLQSPAAFLDWLKRIQPLADEVRSHPAERGNLVRAFHQEQLKRLDATWETKLGSAYSSLSRTGQVRMPSPYINTGAVEGVAVIPANRAMALAIPKSVVETPLMRAIRMEKADDSEQKPELWDFLARGYGEACQFHEDSRNIVAEEYRNVMPHASAEEREQFVAQLIQRLEANVNIDTLRNEQELHRQVHTWFVSDGFPQDFEGVNEVVYAQLFFTPKSDPWLGLNDPYAYAALDNGGQTTPANTESSSGQALTSTRR
ncbi:MAG: hypothetical protein KDA88_02375 [Planctomycetaceae bacterium]|nr:hypothetical protein [Planctomycetaceae bacterium]MCB9952921.1 hypothetical protein [Planctomycetaceae bacterium]